MDARLTDIADVRTGYPFRGKVFDDPAGTLAVVQMKDISDVGHFDPAGCIRIREEPAHGRHLLKAGDVLLQSRGSKFPANVVEKPVHGIAALGLHILRPTEKVLPQYLAWVMNHPSIRELLRGVARGSYIPFLSKSDVSELRVPLPPIQTQRQIVEVARLEREAARLSAELQTLRDEYSAAATWRAATRTLEQLS